MKYLFLFCVSILAVSLQLSIMEGLDFFFAAPDLILAAVLGYALARSERKNYWLIFIPGFLYDLAAGRIFGILLLDLWVSFFLVDWLGRSFFKRNNLGADVFLAFFGAAFFYSFRLVLLKLAGFFQSGELVSFYVSGFYPSIFSGAALNGVLAFVFLFLINRYLKFDGPIAQFKPKT